MQSGVLAKNIVKTSKALKSFGLSNNLKRAYEAESFTALYLKTQKKHILLARNLKILKVEIDLLSYCPQKSCVIVTEVKAIKNFSFCQQRLKANQLQRLERVVNYLIDEVYENVELHCFLFQDNRNYQNIIMNF